MKVLVFLVVIAAFSAVVVTGSAPSEATDLASDASAQRGQAVTAARGARGLLSRKGAISSDTPQAVDGAASAGRLDVQKVKKHRKRPSPGAGVQGASETATVGDRKMLRPPCVTEQECVSKRLFCLKKCSGLMNLQEDPNCLIKCANCFPTC